MKTYYSKKLKRNVTIPGYEDQSSDLLEDQYAYSLESALFKLDSLKEKIPKHGGEKISWPIIGDLRHINELLDVAVEERDHATQVFLQWFITEQVEEEANVKEIVDRLKMIGGEGSALMMIDDKLSQRLPPAPPAAN